MLWQLCYSELYFSDELWPNFNEKEMDKAIDFFVNRTRTYGSKISKIYQEQINK